MPWYTLVLNNSLDLESAKDAAVLKAYDCNPFNDNILDIYSDTSRHTLYVDSSCERFIESMQIDSVDFEQCNKPRVKLKLEYATF